MADSQRNPLEPELLFAVVKEKYGHLLSAQQLDEVRQGVSAQYSLVQPLRSARLTNDVEPFATFRPFRSDEDAE